MKLAADAPAVVWEVEGDQRKAPGGAANAARQLTPYARPGGVTLIGAVGRLEASFLESLGIALGGPESPRHACVPRKTRKVSRGHVLAREDDPNSHPLSWSERERGAFRDACLSHLGYRLRNLSDASRLGVLCSDYAQGLWTPGLAEEVTRLCRDAGVVCTVDAKPGNVAPYFWRQAAAIQINGTAAAALRASDWHQPSWPAGFVVTDGRKPPGVSPPGSISGQRWLCGEPHPPRGGVWASGAGDCFAAHLLAALVGGGAGEVGPRLRAAADWAHWAGGVYVGKEFNAPVLPREVGEARGDWFARVYDGEGQEGELRRRLAALPAGSRVVWTNGVFDLLHRGHLESLAFARRQGDFLCVAMNSDRSAEAAKGRRPVLESLDRAAALAAVRTVGAVVAFSEPTPERLYARFAPDVLVKGPDYAGREAAIPGAAHAGAVLLSPAGSALRTSEIRARLARGGD